MNAEKKKKEDRFKDTSLILSDFAKFLSGPRKNYEKTALSAEGIFRKFGIDTNEVRCFEEDGKTVIYANLNTFDGSINKTLLSKEISKACGYNFDIPSVSRKNKEYTLTLTQIPLLKLRTGTVQYAADKTGVCGDFFIDLDKYGEG